MADAQGPCPPEGCEQRALRPNVGRGGGVDRLCLLCPLQGASPGGFGSPACLWPRPPECAHRSGHVAPLLGVRGPANVSRTSLRYHVFLWP